MKFTYAPEGATPRTWDFDPSKIMSPEAEAIERHTGMEYGDWMEALDKTSMRAIHGLLFVLLKREIPTLKWDEVQFCLGDVEFEPTAEEKATARAEIEAKLEKGLQLDPNELELLQLLVAEDVKPAEDVEFAEDGTTPKES